MANVRERLNEERTYRYKNLQVRAHAGARGLVWRVVLIVCAVAAISVVYVWLQSAGGKNARELQAKGRIMELNAKNLENLRLELESLRGGDNILTKVVEMGLALQPPRPGQVRRVSVDRANPPFDHSERPLVAQY